MKKFLVPLCLLCCFSLSAQQAVSPCANSLLEAVQRLVRGANDTCISGEMKAIAAFGSLSTTCYTFVDKPGTVSFTVFYYPDSASVRVIWGNEKWVYDYYGVCAPNPVVYEAPITTQNHVFELRFLPVGTYRNFSDDKNSWDALKGLQTFKVSDITNITNIKLDAPNSILARTEKVDYEDPLSSKGIRCTVKLKNRRTPVECYVYSNYDKAGTIEWKGAPDPEPPAPNGYIKMNLKLPFSNYAKDYWVQKVGHYYILNGDIIVGDDFPRARSLGVDDRDDRWPNGIVPVTVDRNIYDANMQKTVEDALDALNKDLEVCFVIRTDQEDFIRIKVDTEGDLPKGAGGMSPMGRRGGEQTLTLAKGTSKGVIMHELLHAIGVYHEQSREDRGKWIEIVEDNIQSDSKHNFEIEPGVITGDYDFCSIMHYSERAFGKVLAPDLRDITIRCKDAAGNFTACDPCMGPKNFMTASDISGVAAFYSEINRDPCGGDIDLIGKTKAAKSITAVSRSPETMETWWIEENGSVQAAYWHTDQFWLRYQLAGPGSASIEGGIASVSRRPNMMEVWWVGSNGSIQAAYFIEGQGWKPYQLAPDNSASRRSKITAVCRTRDYTEIWWVAPDESVQGAFWQNGNWTRYTLSPSHSASKNGGISAVCRKSDVTELWWIGPEGSVQGAFWQSGNWTLYRLEPVGSASVTGGLTAVSRIPDAMEVWWIGKNGAVNAASWLSGNWARYQLAPDNSASTESGIDAVSRVSDGRELWYVGPRGSIEGRYRYQSGQWKGYRVAPEGSAKKNSGIAATARVSNTMEFFWIDEDGAIRDGFWADDLGWNWFTLAPKP